MGEGQPEGRDLDSFFAAANQEKGVKLIEVRFAFKLEIANHCAEVF